VKIVLLVLAGALLVVLLLVLLVAGALLWLKRKVKKAMDAAPSGLRTKLTLEPAPMALEPASAPLSSELAERTDRIAALGFSHVGTFSVREDPSVLLDAWVHEGESAYAVVYRHRKAGIWSDFCLRYADAGGLTVSNTALAGLLDPMPGWKKISDKRSDETALWRRFCEERVRHAPVAPASKDSFVADFEQLCKQEMEWRLGRGGASLEEVRRVAEAVPGRFDEKTIAQVQQVVQEQARQRLDDCLKLKVAATMNGAEWEELRERIVIVHASMSADEAKQALERASLHCAVDLDTTKRFSDCLAHLKEQQAAILEWPERTVHELPEPARWRVLTRVSEPVEAIALVMPTEAGDT
jgi:hypothetical protein